MVTYFLMPRAAEMYWTMAKNRNLVKQEIPNSLIIVAAMAVIAWKFGDENPVYGKAKKQEENAK